MPVNSFTIFSLLLDILWEFIQVLQYVLLQQIYGRVSLWQFHAYMKSKVYCDYMHIYIHTAYIQSFSYLYDEIIST